MCVRDYLQRLVELEEGGVVAEPRVAGQHRREEWIELQIGLVTGDQALRRLRAL